MSFHRLRDAIARTQSPLCVGIDPHPEQIGTDPERVRAFCFAVLDACDGAVPAIKPQFAFFEGLGWQGMRVLAELCVEARRRGLIVVADAKRGDIGTTAAAYARATLSADAPFPADVLTVSPFLGLDTLEPFVAVAREQQRGIYVLLRTSNPGSATFQDPAEDALVAWLSRHDDVAGAVVGATHPEALARLRGLLPSTAFLLPGYGAQGGTRASITPAFAGPALAVSAREATFPSGNDPTWARDTTGWVRARIDALNADLAGLTA